MKRLIFLLSVCCLFYSCDKNKYHAISQDKIPILKNSDTVYFQDSVTSKIDTLSLDVKDIWRQTLEGDYFQYMEIYYNKLNSKSPFLSIHIAAYYSSLDINFQIDNYYSQKNFNYSKKNQVIIQGVDYPDVYVLNDTDYHLYPDTIPNTIYYSFNKGIIRYEYKDGRVFELISK